MGFSDRVGPRAQDTLLAVGMAALLSAVVLATPDAGALDLVAVVAGSAALALWRRAPLAALAVSTACMLVVAGRLQVSPTAGFPVMVTVFGAVRAGRAGSAALAALVFLATDLAVSLPGGSFEDVQATSLLLGWFVAAGVAATVARHRRAYLEQVEQRAIEAERTREQVARRRADEERLRIARELHDSLTHSISVIKVQAGVAVHLARRRGDDVPPALLAIQEAGGDAMRELRATLEVLRDPGDEEHRPSGLDRLDALVERVRSTGLAATVTVSGGPRALPVEVDAAAYRIVQEALTNVSRHSGGASASVRVEYGAAELVVGVDDDGVADPSAPPVPGTGLLGMRERVTALDGELRAEPRPEGGFTVRAVLPLADPS